MIHIKIISYHSYKLEKSLYICSIVENSKNYIMIRHIVMWKFRRDLEETPQQIAHEMKSRLEALNGKIDGLLRAEVGVNLKETASSFDAVLTADFPTWEAMEEYKINPLHVVISDYCKSRRLERIDVDYEV